MRLNYIDRTFLAQDNDLEKMSDERPDDNQDVNPSIPKIKGKMPHPLFEKYVTHHLTAWDPFDNAYVPLEQGELDESYAAIRAKLQSDKILGKRPYSYNYPLWSIPSASFVLGAIVCFILAAQVANIKTSSSSVAHFLSGGEAAQHDCSQYQASGLQAYVTNFLMGLKSNETEVLGANGSLLEGAFMLDFQTPPIFS